MGLLCLGLAEVKVLGSDDASELGVLGRRIGISSFMCRGWVEVSSVYMLSGQEVASIDLPDSE